MNYRLKVLVAVLAMGLTAVAVGCGGGSSGGSGSQGEATGIPGGNAPKDVTLELRTDVDTFDPHKSINESGAQQVFAAIYDTPIKLAAGGPDAGGVLPGLATSWTSNPSSATFTLHENLTCTDGSPLTPSGVAKSIERLGNPATGASFATRIFGPGGLKSVKADDSKNTITIKVNEPYTYLVEGMADAYIVCPNGLDDGKKLAQEPAGTGPYELTSSSRGEVYEMTRRDDYNALPPEMTIDQFPEKMAMRVIAEDSTRANLLETGEADIGSILGQDALRLRGSGNLNEVEGAGFGVSALLFNQSKGQIGTDETVRRALSMAVDAADYTKAASFNVSSEIDTVYSPNMDCYAASDGESTPGFDLEQARQILEDDGWVKDANGIYEKDGKALKVRLLGYDVQNSGPEYLLDAFGELGADVELNDTTFEGAVSVLFGTGEWDAVVFPYTAELYVPSLMIGQISGDPAASLNVGDVQNEAFNTLSTEASGLEAPERCKVWQEAETALLDSSDIKPVMWDKAAWFGNGMTFQAQFWIVDLRTIRVSG